MKIRRRPSGVAVDDLHLLQIADFRAARVQLGIDVRHRQALVFAEDEQMEQQVADLIAQLAVVAVLGGR